MSEQRLKNEPVAATSGDILETQMAKLRGLFPEVFVEGKIDFDKLKITLGAAAESGPGHFHFSWAGKDDAVSLLQTPSAGTLIPYPEESINFESTSNIFVEGDNLEVLKLLFKPYFGRVKLIYIDPPYNTGQDFVYPDNYADPLETYLQLTGQVDAEGNLLTSNPETSGRYHSAWLSMMYPRMFLARQLLREDGIVCVSIDDHEVHHLRILMNEVFGEENFIATIVVQANKRGQTFKQISKTHEYLLMYSQSTTPSLQELQKSGEALPYEDSLGPFDLWELRNRNPKFGRHNRPNLFFPIYVCPKDTDETGLSKVMLEGSSQFSVEVWPRNSQGEDGCWRWSKDKIRKADLAGETPSVVAKQRRDGEWNIYERSRKSTTKPKSIWDETAMISEQGTVQLGDIGLGGTFDHPKPVGLITKLLEITTSSDDLVLDFFSGASTTAHAVLQLNHDDGGSRNFIMVQLPEATSHQKFPTIAEIGKERIRRVIAKLIKERDSQLALKDRETPEDLGFKVFKLAKPNIQQWNQEEERDPEVYAQKLTLFNDPLIADWKPENVIWEVALREGFSLNTRFTPRELANGNKVYDVSDPDTEQKFMLCLDEEIRADISKYFECKPDDLFVCRDVALDDSAAANLALQCRLKTI
jgi:adenine-specific DNA-methyltransferase